MRTPQNHRVFIASPSDVDTERVLARSTVERLNAELAESHGITFEIVGWERVRGTAQRPQEAINELIHDCTYFIAILKAAWGSVPGGTLGFTSGTEEELFTALLDLADKTLPMRDVWVAFIDATDPAEEVVQLKAQIRDRHALLYETVRDGEELVRKLDERLRGWAEVTHKIPRSVNLTPRSGRDILRAEKLQRDGEALVEMGYREQGTAKLSEAATIGDSRSKLAYARALARQGDIPSAHRVVQGALDAILADDAKINSPTTADALAVQASFLRREGKHFEATQRLQQALEKLSGEDKYTSQIRARILDDLGLAYQKMGELDRARECIERALRIRQDGKDTHGVAQSEINLARNDVARRDFQEAGKRSIRALNTLETLPPSALHANAHLLRAQLLKRDGSIDAAIEEAQMSEVLNAQLGNDYGLAMAHNVLAQCYARKDDGEAVLRHASTSAQLNRAMGYAGMPPVLQVLVDKYEEQPPPEGTDSERPVD